ncbi:MAG: HEAT repeat domain-containing protein [Pseudomonadota bacterium]
MRSALVLTIAYWVSVAVVVLVVFLMSYILVLRAVLLLRERRYRELVALWRPILLNSGEHDLDRLPAVKPADRHSFLILWNMLREEKDADPEIRDWMNRVAVAVGIDRFARQLLEKRGVRKKLLAVVTLGQLRDKSRWDVLCQMAVSEHVLLSLAAMQAIARIDPAAATPLLVRMVMSRPGWPAAKVASMLKDIGPDLVSEPLTAAILAAPDEEKQRLIPFLETCSDATALTAVRRILKEPHDDKVIGPCLSVLGKFRDKQDLKLVRQYLSHPRWHVRAHAATCLGKTGMKEDEEQLVALLNDAEWWVRYRAAQAIVNMPFSSVERIHELMGALKDRYARDILTQAVAEKGLTLP